MRLLFLIQSMSLIIVIISLHRIAQIDGHFLIFIMMHLIYAIQFRNFLLFLHKIKILILHIVCYRIRLFIIDLLFLFILLETLKVLLLEIDAPHLRRLGKFVTRTVIVVLVHSLVYLGDYLEVGADFILCGSVEFILDYAEQSFIEFQQGVDLCLMGLSYLFQFLELVLAGLLHLFQSFVLSDDVLHSRIYFIYEKSLRKIYLRTK